MKTLIAIPCMDSVPVAFAHSLATMHKVGECQLFMKSGSLIYAARNSLAMAAIEKEMDFVFWLDSDMVFREDTLVRMMDTLQKNDLDILTGLYFRRVPPYSPVLFDRLDMNEDDTCNFSEFTTIPDKLFEVGACGFGCVLMRADVFLDVQSRFGNMFAPIANNGEDVAFCWRARQCGIKIWCDPTIICGHVSTTVVDDAFYRAFSSQQKK